MRWIIRWMVAPARPWWNIDRCTDEDLTLVRALAAECDAREHLLSQVGESSTPVDRREHAF